MIDIIQFQGTPLENLGFRRVFNIKQWKIVVGTSEGICRKAVESKSTDMLLAPEKSSVKDYMHQRGSGLNQVLCALAAKNKVAMGFSFVELLNTQKQARVLGRMRQNVRLCRKYKVKMVLASFAKNKWEMRSASDLQSFGKVLGMTAKEVKQAMNFQKKRREIKVL